MDDICNLVLSIMILMSFEYVFFWIDVTAIFLQSPLSSHIILGVLHFVCFSNSESIFFSFQIWYIMFVVFIQYLSFPFYNAN